jgi:hypothetical protein
MTFIDLLIFGLATYRLTRLITRDTIMAPVVNCVWKRFPPETSKIGYLFTCEWCMSIWVASLLQLSRMIIPTPTYVFEVVLAASAIAGLLTAHEDKM